MRPQSISLWAVCFKIADATGTLTWIRRKSAVRARDNLPSAAEALAVGRWKAEAWVGDDGEQQTQDVIICQSLQAGLCDEPRLVRSPKRNQTNGAGAVFIDAPFASCQRRLHAPLSTMHRDGMWAITPPLKSRISKDCLNPLVEKIAADDGTRPKSETEAILLTTSKVPKRLILLSKQIRLLLMASGYLKQSALKVDPPQKLRRPQLTCYSPSDDCEPAYSHQRQRQTTVNRHCSRLLPCEQLRILQVCPVLGQNRNAPYQEAREFSAEPQWSSCCFP